MGTGAAAGGCPRPFRLVAEAGSADLKEIIGDVGCGCDALRNAATEAEPDEQIAEAKRAAAREAQALWRCPSAGHRSARSAGELDPKCQRALSGVEQLCGAAGLTTCPNHYLRLPWVHRAATARKWAERGQLAIVEPAPSAALIEAINEIDGALAAREAREHAARMKDLEERQKQKP